MIKRLATIVAALGLTLMVVAPALANDLHQATPIASDSTAFQGTADDCSGTNLQPGQVLWHFVHTSAKSSDLPSTLTATFQNAGTVTVNGFTNGNSIVMYNVTTGTDTLLSASDSIINTGLLNLSHICNGGPPPQVPEAPFSALLVLSAAITGLGFFGWRTRHKRTIA